MSGYKRFDRHEIFEMSDTSFVLDCIQKVNKYDYENGGAVLTKMLFGLFDGYYYDKIHYYAASILSISMFEKLEDLLVKIDDGLMAHRVDA